MYEIIANLRGSIIDKLLILICITLFIENVNALLNRYFSFRCLLRSIWRRILTILIIVLAYVLDDILINNQQISIGGIATSFYIVCEITKFLQHVKQWLPIPKMFKKAINFLDNSDEERKN